MPERPRLFLDTKSTASTTYVELLSAKIMEDVKGVSNLSLSIDPDPNARYEIHITRLLDAVDLELTAMWSFTLPHLTSGVYAGIKAGDSILVKQKSVSGTVKTGITLTFNEVVEKCVS